jgi:hypothetical protein
VVCASSGQSTIECTTVSGPAFTKGSGGCVRSDQCVRVILEGSDAFDLRTYLGIGNDGKYILTIKCGADVLVDSAEQMVSVITAL